MKKTQQHPLWGIKEDKKISFVKKDITYTPPKSKEFENIVKTLVETPSTPFIKNTLLTLNKNPKKPLGKLNPWAWFVEITYGCNLSCDFCATSLLPKGELRHMSFQTWENMLNIISIVSPFTRIELMIAGEPTLHPQLLDFLKLARKITPYAQITIITNGTTLINDTHTYKELFEAGVNFMLIDMYHKKEKHIMLAEQSGHMYYEKDKGKCPSNIPQVWTYHKNPDIKVIALQNPPSKWDTRKKNSGQLHSMLNNLDWGKAKKYGLSPVLEAPNRRCDQPVKFVNVFYNGNYSMCCMDFLKETTHGFNNVNEGLSGFFKFWLGDYMQYSRTILHEKNRPAHELCSRCDFCGIRCDIPHWDGDMFKKYWDGNMWKDTPHNIQLKTKN